MSERRPLVPLALAAALLATATIAPAADPAALLARAERVRAAWSEARLRLRVTTERPGTPPQTVEVSVSVKGDEKVRVDFLGEADAGKAFLAVGDEAWLSLPGSRNPIKVPRSHRLTGGFAVADVSRTRFLTDYDPILEREETLDGRPCDVLRLMARPGRKPSYPVLRVWVDRKEGLYRRVVFLLPSGKTAREATFEAYAPIRGTLSVTRMTVTDALRSGTTRVEYLDAESVSLPDSLFDPARLKAPPAGGAERRNG